MDDPISKLINDIKDIKSLDGEDIDITTPIGRTIKRQMEPKLKDRLRQTESEAYDREAMEKAHLGLGIDENRIDEIVEQYVIEKILKEII